MPLDATKVGDLCWIAPHRDCHAVEIHKSISLDQTALINIKRVEISRLVRVLRASKKNRRKWSPVDNFTYMGRRNSPQVDPDEFFFFALPADAISFAGLDFHGSPIGRK